MKGGGGQYQMILITSEALQFFSTLFQKLIVYSIIRNQI